MSPRMRACSLCNLVSHSASPPGIEASFFAINNYRLWPAESSCCEHAAMAAAATAVVCPASQGPSKSTNNFVGQPIGDGGRPTLVEHVVAGVAADP